MEGLFLNGGGPAVPSASRNTDFEGGPRRRLREVESEPLVVSPSDCQPTDAGMATGGIDWCLGTIATLSMAIHDPSAPPPLPPSAAGNASARSPHAASAPASSSSRCTA